MPFDYKKALGLGTDNIDRGVLGMPFLNIIQKGSPEFDETHPKFGDKKIPGCRPGNILFEPERAIIPQPVEIVPLAHTTLYTEWKPKATGGGFLGNRNLDVVGDRNYRKGNPNGPDKHKEYYGENELVYTIYFIVLFKHGEKWKRGMISFTATQLKFARNWMKTILSTKIPGLEGNPPIFASTYQFSTFADSNAKGGFFSWRIERGQILDPQSHQELLEHAFDETQKATLQLPQPAALAALTDTAAPSDQY